MRKAIIALLGVLFMVLGASPANAASIRLTYFPSSPENTVTNGVYSNANLLVCGGPSGCISVPPGYQAFQTYGAWNPTQVAVGANTCMLYRVVKGNYTGPWGDICGGSTGRWLNVQNLQNYFGSPINVDILYNDPR